MESSTDVPAATAPGDIEVYTGVAVGTSSHVFNTVQTTLTSIGIVANVYIIFVLLKRAARKVTGKAMFSQRVRYLLIHQSCMDTAVCILGTALLLGEYTTQHESDTEHDVSMADHVLCYMWYSQIFYWYAICLSIYNLVVIALERYVSICRPLDIQGPAISSMFKRVTFAYYVISIILVAPSIIEVKVKDGKCQTNANLLGDRFHFAYSIVWFTSVYFLPMVAFIFLYGKVIKTMVKRSAIGKQKLSIHVQDPVAKSSHSKERTSVRDNQITLAQSRLTRTAVCVTVFFCFAIGFDSWMYLLSSFGAIDYVMGSPLQRFCLLFSVSNSTINPFIYVAFMPRFRRIMFPLCYGTSVEDITVDAKCAETDK